MPNEITKIVGSMINEKGELLILKKFGSDICVNPGGRVEENETHIETLKRTLKEKLGVDLISAEFYGSFHSDKAMHDPDSSLQIHAYVVKWDGEIKPVGKIEQAIWLDRESLESKKYNVAPQILEQIIPALREKKLINI
ncbi:MAG: NUDIX hydrolase [Patescibacteria group bacterium]|nr:NUDIX hydrolase [Patescibacteria group bacterium]